jgi:hypothetical protein
LVSKRVLVFNFTAQLVNKPEDSWEDQFSFLAAEIFSALSVITKVALLLLEQ